MAKERIAVLNDQGHLIRTVMKVPVDGDIRAGDLPADGTYKWVGHTFMPLGHGHPKPASKPPVSEQLALYEMIRAKGKSAPKASRLWADWYEATLKERDEEQALARAIKARR